MRRIAATLFVLAFAIEAEDTPDLAVLNRIKAEAFQNSQVMDHLFYLTDVYGPRLTNSPGHRAAAEWVVKRLSDYKLQNVKLEKWGPFGQSWKLNRFSAHMLEPQYQPLIGLPLAWTPGTNGVITAEPVIAIIKTDADFAAFKGKLKGKIVLAAEPKQINILTEPLAHRLTEEELFARQNVSDPSRINMFGPARPGAPRHKARYRRRISKEGESVLSR